MITEMFRTCVMMIITQDSKWFFNQHCEIKTHYSWNLHTNYIWSCNPCARRPLHLPRKDVIGDGASKKPCVCECFRLVISWSVKQQCVLVISFELDIREKRPKIPAPDLRRNCFFDKPCNTSDWFFHFSVCEMLRPHFWQNWPAFQSDWWHLRCHNHGFTITGWTNGVFGIVFLSSQILSQVEEFFWRSIQV